MRPLVSTCNAKLFQGCGNEGSSSHHLAEMDIFHLTPSDLRTLRAAEGLLEIRIYLMADMYVPFVRFSSSRHPCIDGAVIMYGKSVLASANLERIMTTVRELVGAFTGIKVMNFDPAFVNAAQGRVH